MKLGWRGILGVVISVALLWWTLRGESFGEIWHVLRDSNLPLFLLSAAVATMAFPIRAWRWRYILSPGMGKPPFAPLWRATAIGMMVNNVALGRAGELARAFVLSRELRNLSFTAALASLVVDRVFDALVILLLLLVVVSLPGFPSGAAIGGMPVDRVLLLGAGVALGAMMVLVVLALNPERVVSLWERVLGARAPRIRERGSGILRSFGAGLSVLREPQRSLVVFLIALLGWLVNGTSFWIAFRAVGIDGSMTTALFLQSILALAVAVPSAPGFFGLFEAGTKVALGVYGIDDTMAVSYALGYHLLSFIPITLFGFWYLARLGMHLKELKNDGKTDGHA